jgi:DHA2 family multidrug resistance protein
LLVMGVTSILAGRLSDLIQPRLLLALGVLILSVVSFQFCAIDAWATGALLLGLITLRRAAQALCQAPLSATALRGVPEDQIAMASGLFNLHRNLAGAVGVALTATMLEYREDVHTVMLSERQALYPLGTEDATVTIRAVLRQEGPGPGGLTQTTAAVLHDQLTEAATLASYHDLFFLFAVLTLGSLVPVLCLRSSPRRTGRAGEAADAHATPQPAHPPVRSAP